MEHPVKQILSASLLIVRQATWPVTGVEFGFLPVHPPLHLTSRRVSIHFLPILTAHFHLPHEV